MHLTFFFLSLEPGSHGGPINGEASDGIQQEEQQIGLSEHIRIPQRRKSDTIEKVRLPILGYKRRA